MCTAKKKQSAIKRKELEASDDLKVTSILNINNQIYTTTRKFFLIKRYKTFDYNPFLCDQLQ